MSMCTHNASGHDIGVRSYVHHIRIYSDKQTSACEAVQILPSNLSEGGSLRSPITLKQSLLLFCSSFASKNFWLTNFARSDNLATSNLQDIFKWKL